MFILLGGHSFTFDIEGWKSKNLGMEKKHLKVHDDRLQIRRGFHVGDPTDVWVYPAPLQKTHPGSSRAGGF